MQTSYFASKAVRNNPNAISIALYPPRYWTGRRFPALAPTKNLLMAAKSGQLKKGEYEKIYRAEVLDKLNPEVVYEQLKDLVLCCFEKEPEHCHRRIVAKWIEEKLSISVEEAK